MTRSARRKRRKPYVWHHAAKWDRDGWNGISYDGIGHCRHNPEANKIIRMRFGISKRKGKRAFTAWAMRIVRSQMQRITKTRRKYLSWSRVL